MSFIKQIVIYYNDECFQGATKGVGYGYEVNVT